MPDVSAEAQPIRADIARIVGLEPEKAAEIAKQRAQEAEVVTVSRLNGEKAYDELKEGQQIDSVALGVGQFDISPIDEVGALVPNVQKRVGEINPPPPQEHIKLYLDSFAQKALEDKNFEPAVACYNYITDEQLTTEESRPYLEKLASAAATPNEKYDLYLALQQVIPQTQEAPAAPEPTPKEQPAVATLEPSPVVAVAEQPTPAATNETDDSTWRAAAGIEPTEKTPVALSETTIESPLISTATAAATTIETAPVVPPANVIPFQRPVEQSLPQPQPITFPSIPATKVPESQPYVAAPNASALRPVPTREEAAAQGLIDTILPSVQTPAPPESEIELAKAA